ncbi:MAG TPA: alpha/beta fold hydrolase [Pyrinomonadaceae bacterium]|nr:alpha/beta fold hydrolase [Pyrinomonadaceae bacterium]
MYVKRYGTGEHELYFGLHGWSGDHRTFAPLAAHVPARASLYSADLPGCGQSPAPPRFDLESVTAEIVAAVRGALAAAPPRAAITLIGNCSGAILGLLVAEQIRERVGRLVLIDPFAYWPWYFRVFVARSFGRYAYRTTFANPLGRWLTNQSLRSRRTAATDLTDSFGRIDHDVAQSYLALLAQVGGVERFESLRGVPIDIVYGERTFGAVKKSVSMWQGVWPQARARALAGAGHLPLLEATAQLAGIVFADDRDAHDLTATTTEALAEQARESEARV